MKDKYIIKAFELNHDDHSVGFYMSSIMGDIYTYDIRCKSPNGGEYLPNGTIHSIEHMLAAALRNGSVREKVIYFGPMGCRTGFYLLLRDTGTEEARKEVSRAIEECLSMEEVPGAKRKECGHFEEHDFEGARIELINMQRIISFPTDVK